MLNNEIRLILVTGEDVHYGFCGNYLNEKEILTDIKIKPYTEVTSKDNIRIVVYSDKVVGCYIKRP